MTGRRDIDRLRSELEDLFNEVWRAPRFAARRCFRPAVDSFRTVDPDRLVVVVELPGVDPEAVHVIASDRTLVVSGERKRPRAGKGGQVYQQMEIDYGPFQRQITLAEDIDPEEATATYDRGTLTVRLPIAPQPAPRESVSITVRMS